MKKIALFLTMFFLFESQGFTETNTQRLSIGLGGGYYAGYYDQNNAEYYLSAEGSINETLSSVFNLKFAMSDNFYDLFNKYDILTLDLGLRWYPFGNTVREGLFAEGCIGLFHRNANYFIVDVSIGAGYRFPFGDFYLEPKATFGFYTFPAYYFRGGGYMSAALNFGYVTDYDSKPKTNDNIVGSRFAVGVGDYFFIQYGTDTFVFAEMALNTHFSVGLSTGYSFIGNYINLIGNFYWFGKGIGDGLRTGIFLGGAYHPQNQLEFNIGATTGYRMPIIIPNLFLELEFVFGFCLYPNDFYRTYGFVLKIGALFL